MDDKLFYEPEETIFYCFILTRLETFSTWAGRKLTRRPRTLSKDRSVDTRKQVSSKKGGNFHEFLKISHIFDILFCFQLECCGWEGVKDFAGTSQPIDDSCYEKVTPTVSGIVAR